APGSEKGNPQWIAAGLVQLISLLPLVPRTSRSRVDRRMLRSECKPLHPKCLAKRADLQYSHLCLFHKVTEAPVSPPPRHRIPSQMVGPVWPASQSSKCDLQVPSFHPWSEILSLPNATTPRFLHDRAWCRPALNQVTHQGV